LPQKTYVPKKFWSIFLSVAKKNNSVIMVCPINSAGIPALLSGKPTKPYTVKSKTQSARNCNAPGLIEDTQLSKKDLAFLRSPNDYALRPLVLTTQEVNQTYLDHVFYNPEKNYFELLPTSMLTIKFIPLKNNRHLVCTQQNEPVRVITFKRERMCCDFDLWCVLPHYTDLHLLTDNPVRVSLKRSQQNKNSFIRYWDLARRKESAVGNMNRLHHNILHTYRQIEQSTRENPTLWHNAASFNPMAPKTANYPITCFMPHKRLPMPLKNHGQNEQEKNRVLIIQNKKQHSFFVQACAREYVHMQNPNIESLPTRVMLIKRNHPELLSAIAHKNRVRKSKQPKATDQHNIKLYTHASLVNQYKAGKKIKMLLASLGTRLFSFPYWLIPITCASRNFKGQHLCYIFISHANIKQFYTLLKKRRHTAATLAPIKLALRHNRRASAPLLSQHIKRPPN
jgi:hypothetical protein